MGHAGIRRTMGLSEWSLLVALSILWGGSFLFVGVAVGDLPPFTIVALRVGLAAAALHIVLLLSGRRLPSERCAWAAFFGMGLINNAIPFSLIAWGQTQIASGLASILNATTPLFVVVIAHVLTDDERMTGRRLGGALVGFLGVAVMIGDAALHRLGTDVLGQLAILCAAITYAFAGIYGRRFRAMGVAPLATATGQVTASSLMLIPLALVLDRPWILPLPGIDTLASIAGLALLSTALAYILYFRVLATAGATNLLLVTLLIPVSAVLLGTTLLGERLEPKHGLGMALIALGLAAIDGRPVEAVRRLLRPERRAGAAAARPVEGRSERWPPLS